MDLHPHGQSSQSVPLIPNHLEKKNHNTQHQSEHIQLDRSLATSKQLGEQRGQKQAMPS